MVTDDYDYPIFEIGYWLFSDQLIEPSKSEETYGLPCLPVFKRMRMRLMKSILI